MSVETLIKGGTIMSTEKIQNFQVGDTANEFRTGMAVVNEVIDEFEDSIIVETPITPPEPIEGTVSGCDKLNLRAEPNGEIVCTMAEGSKVLIDPDQSDDTWLFVYTESGAEGYCMKKYVTM